MNSGAVGRVSFKFTIKMNARHILCGIHNGSRQVGGGLVEGVYTSSDARGGAGSFKR